MSTSQPMLVVTAAVAFAGVLPSAGEEVILSTVGVQASGRFRSITPQPTPEHDASRRVQPPHWSRMAAIEMELSHRLPAIGAQSQTIVLLDPASRRPIASGLTIAVVAPGADGSPRVSPGLTIWLTGLSGAGGTTIARALEASVQSRFRIEILDGDVVRTHICRGLGFSQEDRGENVRRLAFLAKLFAATGAVTVVSAISPYRTMRDEARRIVGNLLEVYVNAPLWLCEERDVKGLYKKARRGEIRSFTGIDDPYEAPIDPEVECRTDLETVAESVAKIHAAILAYGDRQAAVSRSAAPGTL